jgi:hypothetical protein
MPRYYTGKNRNFDFPDPEEVTTVRLASERKETYRGRNMGTVSYLGLRTMPLKTILPAVPCTVKLWHSPTNFSMYSVPGYYTRNIVYSAGLLTFSLLSELFPSYQITLSRSNYKILLEQTNWPSSLISKLRKRGAISFVNGIGTVA